jgi:hypothetical protein
VMCESSKHWKRASTCGITLDKWKLSSNKSKSLLFKTMYVPLCCSFECPSIIDMCVLVLCLSSRCFKPTVLPMCIPKSRLAMPFWREWRSF